MRLGLGKLVGTLIFLSLQFSLDANESMPVAPEDSAEVKKAAGNSRRGHFITGLRGAWVFPSGEEQNKWWIQNNYGMAMDVKIGWEWKYFGVSSGLEYARREQRITQNYLTYDASGAIIVGNLVTDTVTSNMYGIPFRGEFLIPIGKFKYGMQLGVVRWIENQERSLYSSVSWWGMGTIFSPMIVKMFPSKHTELGVDLKIFLPYFTPNGGSIRNDENRMSIGLDFAFRL